jgi:hypothetical protein
MEESGEQCTVVFALIDTEPAECLCVCVTGERRWGLLYPPPLLAGSVTIYAKTTVNFSPDSSMEYGICIGCAVDFLEKWEKVPNKTN